MQTVREKDEVHVGCVVFQMTLPVFALTDSQACSKGKHSRRGGDKRVAKLSAVSFFIIIFFLVCFAVQLVTKRSVWYGLFGGITTPVYFLE